MGDISLTEVIISNQVTDIGARAFKDSGLTHITIPEGVASIGEEAFAITPMTTITIPGNVTTIGENVIDTDTIATAPTGSAAFQYCLDHSITLTYVNPAAVFLSDRGEVTISIADPREQTIMLGVYHRVTSEARRFPVYRASAGRSDSGDSGTLLAVIPVTVEEGSGTVTTNISALTQESGSYYIWGKTVPPFTAPAVRPLITQPGQKPAVSS